MTGCEPDRSFRVAIRCGLVVPFHPEAKPLSASARRSLVLAPRLLALPLLVAACGNVGAPTKADIQQVIQARMQAANRQTSANTLGLFSGPYDVNDFSVTNADCSAKDNGVYSCAVTAVTKKGTNTAQLQFKKVNGSWTLVQS